MTQPMLILASNSPRRKELLALTGWDFRVLPADIDEQVHPGEMPRDYVLRLAAEKARKVAENAPPGRFVIAADTTVTDGRSILGKPQDAAEARAMLLALRGVDHWVDTGMAVLGPTGSPHARLLTDVSETRVTMRAYTDEEIETYIATGDPFDKAGAYAIQHQQFHPVARIEGCFTGVVGLALCRVTRMMATLGWMPPHDVTADCGDGNGATCSVLSRLDGSLSVPGSEQ